MLLSFDVTMRNGESMGVVFLWKYRNGFSRSWVGEGFLIDGEGDFWNGVEGMRIPTRVGEIAGWAGMAFLTGVVYHSMRPFVFVPEWRISCGVAIGAALLFGSILSTDGQYRPWRSVSVVAGACVLFFTVGLWRFDAVIPVMPRGLVPFTPTGLVHARITNADYVDSDPRYWLGVGYRSIRERAQDVFTPDEAILFTGILYGDRGLSKEWTARFRRAGLLHIIAVSGSNVTIVVVLVMSSLLAIGLPRRFAFVFLSVALMLFVLFVGCSASVIRAAIMGWLVELAPVVGRIPRPSRLLLVAASVFIWWHPWSLVFDAGFALSFLAMWGLLTWGRYFQNFFLKRFSSTLISEILGSTIGATLMTAPYLAWAFGNVTLFGLVTNLFALPLLPWIMASGVLAITAPSVFTVLPARGFMEILFWIACLPDRFSFGTWSKLSPSFAFCATCYAVILVVWLYIQRKKRVIHKNVPEQSEILFCDDDC